MLYLRELGIRTYDMGGIAVGAEAAEVSGINDFKIRFGGTMVREDHWISPLYALATLAGVK
jgi:lipid II:glycine glycyltransferase (peptidoglycan interpeptide bridge formation enzyme)